MWPPPQTYLHFVCLAGWMPVTATTYEAMFRAAVSRRAQSESGLLRTGHRERPVPGVVLGCVDSRFSECRNMSNAALLSFIENHCPLHLRAAIPVGPSTHALLTADPKLSRIVVAEIGSPLATETAMKKALHQQHMRHALLRAVLGKVASAAMWRQRRGGPVREALDVWEYTLRSFVRIGAFFNCTVTC